MALDYRKCAEQIAANIGGGANVISAAHCATRLRLVIADNGKVNKKALEEIDGVKGMFESNGQLQLIIGTGTVNKVYDEFLSVTGASAATKDDVKAAAASKMPWWKKILKTPGDIFVPILPAIVASGLMMGLVEAIPKFAPGFQNTGWYAFLDLVANTAFALLPVLVAISAARVFGGNVFLGAVIGLMLVHPALLNAWNAGNVQEVAQKFNRPIPTSIVQQALDELPSEYDHLWVDGSGNVIGKEAFMQQLDALYGTGETVAPNLINSLPAGKAPKLNKVVEDGVTKYIHVTDADGKDVMEDVALGGAVWENIKTKMTVSELQDGGIAKWSLFGDVGISQMGYQGHVIPVILAVLFMCFLEKKLHKIVPEMIDLFVTPLVTVLVTAFAAFLVIGPIFAVVENWVLAGAQWLISQFYGIGAAIMGAIYPLTVVMGLHHMYNVIEAGMIAQTGVNTWMPIASAANFAQFGACLAVALKVHNQKTKSVALPSSLSASLGITEPAIFGINYRFMKPFVCGMIGGAAGSLFATFLTGTNAAGQTVRFGATTYGVTGIPGIPAVNNTFMYIVELLIAAGIAFALTWFIWKEEKPEAVPAEGAVTAAPAEPEIEVPSVSVIRCAAGTVLQPVKGTVIPREEIPDDTFASGVLGDGVGIQPSDDKVVAPFDGTVSSVAESQHAVGIECNGMEMLIHVGVDTVNMKGDGFTCLVKEGDEVKAGQPLILFDREKIKAAGYSDTVAVLLTNSEDMENVECGAR
ncbi:MAG: PTS glucose transporter subunit IIA [Clostridia bacterium]|nr:PTS glucose transporter subunit IIA [Clostridia bacterium]MCR4887395.1 glucose PTS transporter subunit IIA [Clostridiales bacterium]